MQYTDDNYSSSKILFTTSRKEILELVTLCKRQRRKVYISNNLKLALKFNFDGIYIPSFIKVCFSGMQIPSPYVSCTTFAAQSCLYPGADSLDSLSKYLA